MRGGSTIGPINSTQAGINSIDIGVPMLAMHSIRELCGVSDHFDMYKALKEFFRI
jgi:aspartyl aminopeptidase